MNNYVNYYYNIYPDFIHEQDKIFYFQYNDEKYYFVMFNRPVEEAKYLYELNVEMIRRNSLVHEFILNKDKDVLTYVNDIPYVLMKIYVNEKKKSDLAEIVYISMSNTNITKDKVLDRSDWATLWSYKVDYFEYQISQIGKKHPLLCEYLSYYIGLTENAISYAKNTFNEIKMGEQDALTVAHRRIGANDTGFDIYNPLSIVIDHQVRDFAEYIKAKFFADSDVWPEIEEYFRHCDMSTFSRRLLYARLLYPSYFFDVYEDIVEGMQKEDEILPIVYKSEKYENFLVEVYSFLNRENVLPPIDWLNKKNSY
jgi:spore coat protein YutH